MRRGRLVLVWATAALMAMSLSTTTTAAGAVPEYQRVISSRSAGVAAAVAARCLETRIWIASSDNVFGGRPGRVVKQGLTSVLVEQVDTCGPAGAAAPGPGVVVFEGSGQTLDPLRSTPRFTRAWIEATIPVLDEVSGRIVHVTLAVTWTPAGRYQRDTTHSHVRDPHGGIVNSHGQTLLADATASGSVRVGADPFVLGRSDDAHLEQVKYGCQLIRHPRGSTDLSC